MSHFYPRHTRVRGHEFRYFTVLEWAGRPEDLALNLERGTGFMGGRDGLVKNNVMALYTHVLATVTRECAPGLIRRAATWYQGQGSREDEG